MSNQSLTPRTGSFLTRIVLSIIVRKYANLGILVKLKSEDEMSIPGLPPWIFTTNISFFLF